MSLDEQKAKLLKAMGEDTQANLNAFQSLTQQDLRPRRISIPDPSTPDKRITFRVRVFNGPEMLTYYRRLEQIHPDLLAKNWDQVGLSAEQITNLHQLWNEYISLATGIPAEDIAEHSDRIRYLMIVGVLKANQPCREELEDVAKFRDDQ